MIPFASHTLTGTAARTELLRFRLLQLFVFVLPFDILYSNIALFLVLATTLLDLNRSKLLRIPKQVWIFQLLYFLAAAGYVYSSHKHAAGFLLERQLTILLIPLLLPLAIEFDDSRKRGLLNAFTLSLVLTIPYLFVNAFGMLRQMKLPLSGIMSQEFFHHRFSDPIGIHAGYLSLYVAIAIFYLLQRLFEPASKTQQLLFSFGLLILFAGLFFLAARNVWGATFVIVCGVFPFFYIRNKLRFFSVVIVLLAAALLAATQVPYLKKRFTSEFASDISAAHNRDFTGVEPRIDRWVCAGELIAKSPLYGYGTGDEIPMLQAQYMQHGLYISYLEEFNAHNQYLSYLLKNGIIGLAALLFCFGWFLRLAVRAKDFIYISFLLLLLIGFATENILDTNKGILFFALFNTFFGYRCLLIQAGKNNSQVTK